MQGADQGRDDHLSACGELQAEQTREPPRDLIGADDQQHEAHVVIDFQHSGNHGYRDPDENRGAEFRGQPLADRRVSASRVVTDVARQDLVHADAGQRTGRGPNCHRKRILAEQLRAEAATEQYDKGEIRELPDGLPDSKDKGVRDDSSLGTHADFSDSVACGLNQYSVFSARSAWNRSAAPKLDLQLSADRGP